MQNQALKKEWKKILLLYATIIIISVLFYWILGKAFAFGWLLGTLFTQILQIYRKFMYQRIYHNFDQKIRIMFDFITHQFLVLLIVIVPFVISIKYRTWFDPIAVFLAFFCERIYWLVTHYLKEKRRV